MTDRAAFAEVCRRVCAAQDWELLPTGVVVRWGDGRKQVIELEIFEQDRDEIVRFCTRIGPASALTREQLETALKTNARLAHGALAIRGGELCMTDTILIAASDAAVIEASIAYLAREADEYERAIYGKDEN